MPDIVCQGILCHALKFICCRIGFWQSQSGRRHQPVLKAALRHPVIPGRFSAKRLHTVGKVSPRAGLEAT